MKTAISVLLFLLTFTTLKAQAKYETFPSNKLGEQRQLKIQLPRGYSTDTEKSYPVFIVLDGDYMFEMVAGNVDFYSYWEDMPDAIVVGINQIDKRYDDCMYSEQNSLPKKTGAEFFEFIGLELLPYINSTYRTTDFKVAVGHGETANFINYYLLKPNPVFQAYIVISPELAPNMLGYIPENLSKSQRKTFYYLANTVNDNKSIRQMTEALDTDLSTIESENVFYEFKSYESGSHYSLPTQVIPNALEKIFKVYQPITKKQYKEEILELEISPVLFLEEKYQEIKDVFGVEKQILINDIKAVAAAIEKNEAFEYYEELGKLARDYYPKTMLGNYYLGRYYEELGEPKKAMRTYQSAYLLDEIGGVTKDMALQRADAIKEDFGY